MRKQQYKYGAMEHFPALTYHYGLSFGELVSMPRPFLELYVKQLPKILAESQLRNIEAATFPHAKQDAQKKLMRQLNREASRGQKHSTNPTAKSPILMRQQLGGIGIGVRFVDAEGKEEVS